MIQTKKCIHKKESERCDTSGYQMCQKALPRKQESAEDMFVTKKCVFREKLRCDALDTKDQNLVHKQDVCTI